MKKEARYSTNPAASMLIDHIIYGAPDLEIAVADIERRFAVRPSGGGKHTRQGTHKKLLSLGPRTYLEIVALILSVSLGHRWAP